MTEGINVLKKLFDFTIKFRSLKPRCTSLENNMDTEEAKTEKLIDKMDKSLLILTGVAILIGIIIVFSCYVRRRDRVIYLCKGKIFLKLVKLLILSSRHNQDLENESFICKKG